MVEPTKQAKKQGEPTPMKNMLVKISQAFKILGEIEEAQNQMSKYLSIYLPIWHVDAFLDPFFKATTSATKPWDMATQRISAEHRFKNSELQTKNAQGIAEKKWAAAKMPVPQKIHQIHSDWATCDLGVAQYPDPQLQGGATPNKQKMIVCCRGPLGR